VALRRVAPSRVRQRREEDDETRRSMRRRSQPKTRITRQRLRRLVGEHEVEDDTSGDTTGSVYQRGRARLPKRPIPVAQRSLIKPKGTR
jgi:hypothetical protein